MIEEFIKTVTNTINKKYTCYYEDAPKEASFPFVVMTNLTLSSQNESVMQVASYDLYVMNAIEQTDKSNESIIDEIRTILDRFNYLSSDIGFINYSGSTSILKENEYDLDIQKIGFTANIFERRN